MFQLCLQFTDWTILHKDRQFRKELQIKLQIKAI